MSLRCYTRRAAEPRRVDLVLKFIDLGDYAQYIDGAPKNCAFPLYRFLLGKAALCQEPTWVSVCSASCRYMYKGGNVAT